MRALTWTDLGQVSRRLRASAHPWVTRNYIIPRLAIAQGFGWTPLGFTTFGLSAGGLVSMATPKQIHSNLMLARVFGRNVPRMAGYLALIFIPVRSRIASTMEIPREAAWSSISTIFASTSVRYQNPCREWKYQPARPSRKPRRMI